MDNFRIVVRTMLSIEILVLTIGMLISGTSIQFIGLPNCWFIRDLLFNWSLPQK